MAQRAARQSLSPAGALDATRSSAPSSYVPFILSPIEEESSHSRGWQLDVSQDCNEAWPCFLSDASSVPIVCGKKREERERVRTGKDRGNQARFMGPRTGQEGDSKGKSLKLLPDEETRTVRENGSGSHRERLTSLSVVAYCAVLSFFERPDRNRTPISESLQGHAEPESDSSDQWRGRGKVVNEKKHSAMSTINTLLNADEIAQLKYSKDKRPPCSDPPLTPFDGFDRQRRMSEVSQSRLCLLSKLYSFCPPHAEYPHAHGKQKVRAVIEHTQADEIHT